MPTRTDTYDVGLSTTDITPPVGIYLAGFGARQERSEGIYHPLRATAIAIHDGTTPLLLVAADLLGFYELTDPVRDGIRSAIGLEPQNVVLCGSHTHCGPSIRELDRERHGELDRPYLDGLVDSLVRCAKEAWEARTPARLRSGTGSCGFARSRRAPDGEGGVLWKPSPESPCDHEVPVLAVESPQGELRGVMFGYACHPTSRGGLLIGGDYVGFAYEHVEKTYPGVTACFLQGCGGDQKPVPVDPDADRFVPREIEEVRDIGIELGTVVNEVLASDGMQMVEGPLTITQRILDLETEPLDLALLEDRQTSEQAYEREWATDLLDKVAKGTPIPTQVPFEVQGVRFGDSLCAVSLSGEMTVEQGLRLKRDLSPFFDSVLVIGYANHIVGYVPVRRQIPEGGYEVWRNNQLLKRTGPFVADTEDRIHVAAHEALGMKP